jgi:hypothetical protein
LEQKLAEELDKAKHGVQKAANKTTTGILIGSHQEQLSLRPVQAIVDRAAHLAATVLNAEQSAGVTNNDAGLGGGGLASEEHRHYDRYYEKTFFHVYQPSIQDLVLSSG